MNLRAAVYVRVSTQSQGEDGTSLETQRAACEAHARERGYHVAGVFSETFTGAELWERPRLSELRERVRRKQLDVVVCYAIDRLARDPVHLGVVVSEAEYHGCRVEFVTEPLDKSPEAMLIQYVRGYAAQVEREKIRERTLRGKRAKLLEGKLPGANGDLYGYRRNGDVRTIFEPEAIVVRDTFNWVTDEHLSIRGVTRRLNTREIPGPRGGVWGKTQVYRILTNHAYKGVTVAWRWKSRGTNRASFIRPESEWITLPDNITPAIVSEAQWAAAQVIIASNVGDSTRNEQRQYLLRGLMWCERCGRRMHSNIERGKTRIYRCSSRDQVGGPCGVPRVPADDVEREVWAEVERIIRSPDLIAEVTSSRAQPGDDAGAQRELDAARRQLERIDRSIDRLLQQYRFSDDGEGALWDAVQRQAGEAEREKRVIRDRIARLERELAQREEAWRRRASLDEYAATVRDEMARGISFDRKRRVLLAFGVRIEAGGRAWRLSLSLPE